MIKTAYGKLEAHGTLGELKADLSVIVHGIYNNALLDEMSEEEAKEFIFDAVNRALKSTNEAEKESEEIIGELNDLIEELESVLGKFTSKAKGKGER